MSLVTLADVLQPALREGYAVAGLVVLGWEDARAYVAAAEAENVPVILQAGPSCRAHTPLPILAAMFRHLGERASVPVVAHLDHGRSLDECREAVDSGFTSIMYDGSRDVLDRNIAVTAAAAELAHAHGLSCEGEVGFVGYDQGEASARTQPRDAARFARETHIDAMAISVGNVHLQQTTAATIDFDAVQSIQQLTDVPLVLHGGSGIPGEVRQRLASRTAVCKFNIGTELRRTFGEALRAALARDPATFDRIKLLAQVEAPVCKAARDVLRTCHC